jgi:hypothetical protein
MLTKKGKLDLSDEREARERFWCERAEWSEQTFGPKHERGPEGPLKHLEKERLEALANPKDIMEYVDCIFLIEDAAYRAGFSYYELMEALWKKLEINKARKWGKPSTDGVIEHVRE